MKVSWDWLEDYINLDMPAEEVENRLAMSGLNHESSQKVGNDLQIDLEVTSNRSDCLGHIGIAREIGVLWKRELCLPNPELPAGKTAASDLIDVKIECPELCPRYTARVIQGVKVGRSPDWLANRLTTIGVAVINNIVDITNYVMLECGQPLHAFDRSKISGEKIIVREATKDEPFMAIDHREYVLQPGMCVIADATRPVALGGVMGGADTEVSDATTDVLIEAADFDPLSIRSTARALRLHSDSSYRFERRVDPVGVEWASRRACQLILEIAGGQIANGIVDAHPQVKPATEPVVLRFAQLKRILGIEMDPAEVVDILTRLGLEKQESNTTQATATQVTATQETATQETATQETFVIPSWRKDLPREIDLVEEVARIHGYDKIPEDVGVPMAASHRTETDRVLAKVRHVLTSAGFDEALTISVTDEQQAAVFSPWTSAEPIKCEMPMLRGADLLRRSLVPSILTARKTNESLSNERIELFETAKVYLPKADGLPDEPTMLALTSGGDFRRVKGVISEILSTLHLTASLQLKDIVNPFFADGQGVELSLGDQVFGFLGVTSAQAIKASGLRQPSTIAEIRLDVLRSHANLIPQQTALSPYPAIDFDFNFIVDEAVRWSDLEKTVIDSCGPHLERVRYLETYRDAKRDGAGSKRLLLSVVIRSATATLTGDEAESIRTSIISACEKNHQAKLLA